MSDFSADQSMNTSIEQAAKCLLDGGIVAFPTETFYGLAVNCFDEQALERLFKVKKRTRKKPLLVLIENIDQLPELAKEIPDCYMPLIQRFWPGPLTLIFPAKKKLPKILCGGTDTIGIRMSPNEIAQRLVHLAGAPITATSANLSGQPAAVTAQQVKENFKDNVDYIIDGGKTPGKLASTIVGLRSGKLVILRQGSLDLTPYI